MSLASWWKGLWSEPPEPESPAPLPPPDPAALAVNEDGQLQFRTVSGRTDVAIILRLPVTLSRRESLQIAREILAAQGLDAPKDNA